MWVIFRLLRVIRLARWALFLIALAGGWKGLRAEVVVPGPVEAQVVSVYDGDTFRANIPGWPELVGHRIGVRVNGIDTPEIRGRCEQEKQLARQARDRVRTLVSEAKGRVTLTRLRRGKYFRIVANVSIRGRDLGDLLIHEGLARPYDGGRESGWCH